MRSTSSDAVDVSLLDTPRRSRRIRDTTPADVVPTTPRQRASAKGSPKAKKATSTTPAKATAFIKKTVKKTLPSTWRAPHWGWQLLARGIFFFWSWCFIVWLPIMHCWSMSLLFFAWSTWQTVKASKDVSLKPSSAKWMYGIFALQIAVVLLTTFLKYRFTFQHYRNVHITTLGEVTSSSARIFARYPHPNQKLQLQLQEVAGTSSAWTSTPHSFTPTAAEDFVGHAHLTGLKADTAYHYRWVNATGSAVLPADKTNTFRTQNPKARSLKFVFGSCWKAGFPFFDDLFMLRKIKSHEANLMIHMGDIIYSDQPQITGTDVADYALHYRQLLNAPNYGNVFGSLPLYTMYDDHELRNNWDKKDAHPFGNAKAAWQRYLGALNPMPIRKTEAYYTFTYGDDLAAFFVMDTRRYRDSELLPHDDPSKTMLGKEQLADFFKWLKEVDGKYTWKFVISPDPFTIMWKDKDLWWGYQHERQQVLDAMKKMSNIVILSGDRHQVLVTKMKGYDVHEFSASPFAQFTFPVRIAYERPDIFNKTVDQEVYHLPADGVFATTMYGVMDIKEVKGKSHLNFILYTGSPMSGVHQKWSHTLIANE